MNLAKQILEQSSETPANELNYHEVRTILMASIAKSLESLAVQQDTVEFEELTKFIESFETEAAGIKFFRRKDCVRGLLARFDIRQRRA